MGTSPSLPWKTINKLNLSAHLLRAGDSVLFNRGDSFYGQIIPKVPGAEGAPITYGVYGTGPKPVISGFSTISSWKSIGRNIWEADLPKRIMTVNEVVINDALQPIGRYPKATALNNGYLAIQSHTDFSSIIDPSLTGSPDFTGGEIVIRMNHWILNKQKITSQMDGTLTFSLFTKKTYPLVDGSGYFIQNHPAALSQNGDWYYDPSTNKIGIYEDSRPSGIKVPAIDQLVTIDHKDYLTFRGLSFKGANTKAIDNRGSSHFTVDHCDFNFSGTYAMHISGASDIVLSNNTVSNSLNDGILVAGNKSENVMVKNNTITNTGTIAGMGVSGDQQYMAMIIRVNKNAVIEHNTITNTGYIPLNFYGNDILIKNNVIDHYSYVKDDGGGIYIYNGHASSLGGEPPQLSNINIQDNIVSNGIGAPNGTKDRGSLAQGIYMDNNSNHVNITGNTVFNIIAYGSLNNSPQSIRMTGNTFFNVGEAMHLGRYQNDGGSPAAGGQDIKGLDIENNIFIANSSVRSFIQYLDLAVNFPSPSTVQSRIRSMGTIDNNYYDGPRPLVFEYRYRNDKNSKWITSKLSYAQWKSFTGYDLNSIVLPVMNDQFQFEYNPTDTIKTVTLDGAYIDVTGKRYPGAIDLLPYTSLVLEKHS